MVVVRGSTDGVHLRIGRGARLDDQRGQFDEVLCSIHASRARKDAINPVAIGAAFRFRRYLYAHMKH